ncbi:NERD domain-containing protein [Alkalihalobacterium alkalinitrilicum]|uniref:NERD domain-containing protein n=1 Tax=Alkalihalobacterium alkalinitrilicum TaxID=427920 RepID=UPI001EE4ADE4|nr:NERD domain-containing protein [Alkalihalobacterium alkalinitrilicum]
MEFLIPIIILTIIFAMFKPQIKGFIGEKTIATFLSQLDKEKYIVINDVVLNVAGKTSQIDHVIVSNYGVFVIETKNYKGWIYGGEKNQYWTQVIYKRKERFYNPLWQNYGHVKALQNALINFGDIPYIPIVVFSINATLKKVEVTSDVVYSVNLLKTIKKYDQETLSQSKKEQIINQLKVLNHQKDGQLKKQHVQTIKQNQKTAKEKVQQNICPKCGNALVIRNGKGGTFKGCSSFPKCRFTANT